MDKKIERIFDIPSLWCIDGELGICYPERTDLGDNGYSEYFDNETKTWKNSPWNAEYLFAYQEHPQVEFIGLIE